MSESNEQFINDLNAEHGEPTNVSHHENGEIRSMRWSFDGSQQLLVEFDPEGGLKRTSTRKNNEYHSFDDEPSKVQYNRNGLMSHKIWHKHGIMHRTGAPAVLKSKNGKPATEEYLVDGIMHRTDGPARTEYGDPTASRLLKREDRETWMIQGKHCDPELIIAIATSITDADVIAIKLAYT